ncbi:hypothetical protein BH23CHL8_BH23CHL8_12830 [soil metagenome]
MQTHTSPYSGRPIVDWYEEPYTLKDADGDTIGDIVEVNPDFLVVESDGGFLGLGEKRQYFIPRGKIAHADGNDWYLAIDKDDVEAMGWTDAPTTSDFATEDWQERYGYSDEAAVDAAPQGRMRLVRFEEELEANKVTRQAGEVTVRKDVVEETRTIEVPVRREEVHVERRPVTDASAATADTAFTETDQTIRVPVMEEEVEVRKVARPVEEVVVTKDATEETRQVSDTVRKERFDIEGDEGSRDRAV